MIHPIRLLILGAFAAIVLGACTPQPDTVNVRVTTNLGEFELELNAKAAPLTVRNFANYVETGFYNGTIFHRVIPGFMIQGGGLRPGMDEKVKGPAIPSEADNGLKNVAGSVAMARMRDPHSAAAQFFINLVDNPYLDHREKSTDGWGYTVFGKVTKGMDTVMKIANTPTHTLGPHANVPVNDVVITKVEILR